MSSFMYGSKVALEKVQSLAKERQAGIVHSHFDSIRNADNVNAVFLTEHVSVRPGPLS